MQIIDRYVFKQVFWSYILLLVVFIFLHIIIDVFVQLSDILKSKAHLSSLLKYYIYFTPQIFLRVSPISFLISSLYSVGALNKNNEIISLRIQGLSILGIAKIFIVFSMVVSFLSLFIEDKVLPLTLNSLNNPISKQKEVKEKLSNVSLFSENGLIIFAKEFNLEENSLHRVKIFIQDKEGNILKEIIAERLVYKQNRWQIENAYLYTLSPDQLNILSSKFIKAKEINIPETPQDFSQSSKISWANLSLKALRKQIKKFSLWKEGKIINNLKVELHKKIAFSFSPLFLLLGGLPFALRIRKRKVGLSSLGLSILISFVYYLLFSIGTSLGSISFFNPLIGCWLANIFLGISGVISLLLLK
ncbi:MAG TPA: YjgP/YjgQ family permease [Candidatus Omnitrophica bacterium]|nr:MAG: hypothetical protein DRP61_04535 [Candidatus Omnitrophota bacterium]RKY34719.1 MAG: hypothetical protein DRP69_03905 [Candidatus Omnitrophota bacterium]RKY43467.1 MAG: hypothetical protein DRP80_05170 [Candidatus Omnitrophota bacterium]HEC69666.1 YjgP/YjgQ family permease [Candidatus Omnitrophota bacterium]